MKPVGVGLIGAGTVGCGVYRLLAGNRDLLARRLGFPLELVRIADIDPDRPRPVDIPRDMFTTRASEVIDDPAVDIVVELIGGTTAARNVVMDAIERGKHVVTANKALLAHHGREIFSAASEKGVDVGFEASVGGGIPIVRTIRQSLVADEIVSIHGIMNGTTNYILTKMTQEGRSFEDVLAQAQREGYAEADPSFDIDGIDAAHKISILAMLSFGAFFEFETIPVQGIRHITTIDISFAEELGYVVKLLAVARSHRDGIEIGVHPALVEVDTPLAEVSGVFNAIQIEGEALGPALLYGQGAGMMPTATAVVGDVAEIARAVNGNASLPPPPSLDEGCGHRLIASDELYSRFYIRFQVEDRPGVLACIAGILGKYNISIESVLQKGRHIGGGNVPVVIMTHEAAEKDLLRAIEEINAQPVSNEDAVFLRIAEI